MTVGTKHTVHVEIKLTTSSNHFAICCWGRPC